MYGGVLHRQGTPAHLHMGQNSIEHRQDMMYSTERL